MTDITVQERTGILQELLNEIQTNNLDQQVKQICDKIMDEEKVKIEKEIKNFIPQGPNIFLSIPCSGRSKKEKGCLCLEREMVGVYIVTYWTSLAPYKVFKKAKSIEVKEDKAEKILKVYAEHFKFINGRI